jgi:hypothetical protein
VRRFLKRLILGFAEKEQDIADACRRLVRNAAMCWNYLYLSQRLSQTAPGQQSALLDTLKAGSAVAWQHINMRREYDFSDEKLTDSLGLTDPKLIDLQHPGIWEATTLPNS